MTKADLRKRGFEALSRLSAARAHLPSVGAGFGQVGWTDLSPLFEVAHGIKPTPSPVFASKLCHFVRPDLYVVVDRTVVGLSGEYRDSWAACSTAWSLARKIHGDLRVLLAESAGVSLPPTYPFGTKITELCIMGAKAVAQDGLTPKRS